MCVCVCVYSSLIVTVDQCFIYYSKHLQMTAI